MTLVLGLVGSEIGGALLGEGVVAFGLTGSAIGFALSSEIGNLLFEPAKVEAQQPEERQ